MALRLPRKEPSQPDKVCPDTCDEIECIRERARNAAESNFRTLEDLENFCQRMRTYGHNSETVIEVLDMVGNTHGIIGFTMTSAAIKIGKAW